jgi:hypothetical protein
MPKADNSTLPDETILLTGRSIPFLRFHYILVQDPRTTQRVSLFHLLSTADIASLRCLMTLLLLPADTLAIDPSFPTYRGAIRRVFSMPGMRKVSLREHPPAPIWENLLASPLLVLLVTDNLPEWLSELTEQRPVGLLTPSRRILEELSATPRIFPGLLQGSKTFVKPTESLGSS